MPKSKVKDGPERAGMYLSVPKTFRDRVRDFAYQHGYDIRAVLISGVLEQIEKGKPIAPVGIEERMAAIGGQSEAAA